MNSKVQQRRQTFITAHPDYHKNYRLSHPEKCKRYSRTYYLRHTELIKQKSRAYYQANRERILARQRELYAMKKLEAQNAN